MQAEESPVSGPPSAVSGGYDHVENGTARILTARAAVAALAGYAIISGVLALAGWGLNLPRLTDWTGTGISMMPNAALGGVLAGAALVMLLLGQTRFGAGLGAMVAFIGVGTVLQHLSGWNLGIDRLLLARDWGQNATVSPGRMGPPAAASFAIMGIAIALSGMGRSSRRAGVVGGLAVIAIAALSVMGYLFKADHLYSLPRLTAIAMPTSSMLLALGLGLVASARDVEPMKTLLGDSAAALLVRRLLPLVVLVPIVVGWLRIRGQTAGLYDQSFGAALRTLVEVTLGMVLLWWAAGAVRGHEQALRRSEAELRRQKGQLAAFLDTAAIAMHRVGPDGIILWANDAELAMLGYGRDEYIGQPITRFHADRDVIGDILTRLGRGERLREYEAVLVCKDGSLRTVLIDSSVLWENGQFIHTQCFTRDITAQRAAEKARRESEVRYGLLFNSMDEGFCTIQVIFDDQDQPVDYRFLEVNGAFEKQTGLKDARGKRMRELAPEHEQHWFDIYGRIALTGEPARFENQAKALSRWYEVYAYRVGDPEQRIVAILFNDITTRKNNEAALQESESRTRAMIDAFPAAIYTTDARGRLTYFNPAAVEFSGREPELGTDEWCISWKLFHPDGTPMPNDQCPMAIALKEGRVVRGVEAIAERPDGKRIWFQPYPTPLRDAQGRITGGINMLVDITERKRSEMLVNAQREALELLASGAPLKQVLEYLVSVVGRVSGPGMLASIVPLNEAGTHFEEGNGADLPAAFNEGVRGVEVRSLGGICCHAVFHREPILIRDFSASPEWAGFAAFVAPFGLRSGWSTPIFSSTGQVLGTFACYLREPGDPTPCDREMLDIVLRTSALAIERTRADKALRQRTAQFETLLNGAPMGVYVVDADLRIIDINPTALPVFGDNPGLIGSDLESVLKKLWPASSAREIAGHFRRTLETGESFSDPERIETRLDRGVTEYYEWRLDRIPLPDGRPGVVCYFRDISAQVRAREILAESEERFRTLFASAPIAVFVCDINAVIQQYNRRAAELWGREPRCGVDRHCGSVRLWLPDGAPLAHEQSPINEVLRTGQPALNVEVDIERPDGSRLPVIVSFAPLRNAAGEIIGAITSFMDITERKRIETELAAHQQLLERRVTERTQELVAAHERLRLADRMAAVGTLAAGLAHDMKNVLLPLGMRLDSLLTGPGLTAEAGTDLAAVAALLDHLRAMANNLSLFARDPAQEGTEGRTDPALWCGQVRGFIDASAGSTVVLKWIVPDGLPPIAVAPHRLTQAVLNLVHNARDAIPSARGALAGTPASGRITVEATPTQGPAGPAVAITVSDDGCGMSEEVLHRCREPFFTTKDRPSAAGGSGGTGLGLSLAHAIVERAGGGMEIDSQPGRGTTVTLKFPIAPPEQPSARASVSVEDKRTRALVGHVLSSLRYEVQDTEPVGRPEGTIWVADAKHLTPQQAADFIRRAPGRRVIAFDDAPRNGTAPGLEAAGVVVLARTTPMARLRAVLAGERPHGS